MLQDSTPQSTAQLFYQVHMMSHTCITCPLSFLDWVHVTSFSQLSCLPSPLLSQLGSLSSPSSSYLVLGACYVIQLLDLLPSGVQYCACISVNLSQSTMLVVASCWTRKRIQFTWTFTCTFQCTLFYFNNKCLYQKMSNFWVTGKSKEWEMGWLQTLHSAHDNAFNICCMMCQCFEEENIIMTTSTTNNFCDFFWEEVDKLRYAAFLKIKNEN